MTLRPVMESVGAAMGWQKGHYTDGKSDPALTYFFLSKDGECRYSAPLADQPNSRIFASFDPFNDWNDTMRLVGRVAERKSCQREGITDGYVNMIDSMLDLDRTAVCLNALKAISECSSKL